MEAVLTTGLFCEADSYYHFLHRLDASGAHRRVPVDVAQRELGGAFA